MGHALPINLIKKMIFKIMQNKKDFILWSEELNANNSKESKKAGFHFISGCLWDIYPRIGYPSFMKILLEQTISSEIPVVAAPETPDTPRANHMFKDLNMLNLVLFLNSFIPNSISFINNGMEIGEIQPMNLGLGNNESGRYILPKTDSMYGKLAFFDNYKLHWTGAKSKIVLNLVQKSLNIRRQFSDLLSNKENFIPNRKKTVKKDYILMCYADIYTRRNIFLLCNTSHNKIKISFHDILPTCILNLGSSIICEYSNQNSTLKMSSSITIDFEPLEIFIGYVQ